ncbi:MAG: hypothetical protein AB1540_16680 [Bdellovibrionota bacterium]
MKAARYWVLILVSVSSFNATANDADIKQRILSLNAKVRGFFGVIEPKLENAQSSLQRILDSDDYETCVSGPFLGFLMDKESLRYSAFQRCSDVMLKINIFDDVSSVNSVRVDLEADPEFDAREWNEAKDSLVRLYPFQVKMLMNEYWRFILSELNMARDSCMAGERNSSEFVECLMGNLLDVYTEVFPEDLPKYEVRLSRLTQAALKIVGP